MHHWPGICSQHRWTGSLVPSAVPNGTLIRESCRLAGQKRLFYTYFGGVYPQILTQQRQIWSPLADPLSPSFFTNFVKIRQATHTYEAKNFQIAHQSYMKKHVFNFSLSPQPTVDPVRKLLHGCTTTFLPLYKSIKSCIKILHHW